MKRLWIGLLLFLLVPSALAQKKVPKREDNRVIYDYGRLLDAEAKESILKITWPLFKVKRPIIILTVNKLADWGASPENVHEFSTLVYNTWGIGSRTTENMGALIVVAKDDRKMSLIVGEGITGYRQEQAAPIINDVMGPNFKDGDFAGGIREGAIAIRDRIFQPKVSEDLSQLPYETPPPNAAGGTGGAPQPGGGQPGDIGLPGPGDPAPSTGDPGQPFPGGTPPRAPREERPGPGRTGPGFPGTNLHFQCGRWFCLAIGALLLLKMFMRRRQPGPGYGYGPQYGPPPPGYGHYPQRRGGGLGGMLGGILTGMLINNMGRRHSGGGGSFGGSSGGSVFGDSGGGGGGSWGGGGSGSWGGGGGGGGGGFGGGSSSGGGASGSW
jgi:uncharacterized membrane protein YgcG